MRRIGYVCWLPRELLGPRYRADSLEGVIVRAAQARAARRKRA